MLPVSVTYLGSNRLLRFPIQILWLYLKAVKWKPSTLDKGFCIKMTVTLRNFAVMTVTLRKYLKKMKNFWWLKSQNFWDVFTLFGQLQGTFAIQVSNETSENFRTYFS